MAKYTNPGGPQPKGKYILKHASKGYLCKFKINSPLYADSEDDVTWTNWRIRAKVFTIKSVAERAADIYNCTIIEL